MNNTKIDISKLHSDYDSYVLTNHDKNRIRSLKDTIRNNDINFKFFITISPYKFIADNHEGRTFICDCNKFLRIKIRKFYKSDIKIWFFTKNIRIQIPKIFEDYRGTFLLKMNLYIVGKIHLIVC